MGFIKLATLMKKRATRLYQLCFIALASSITTHSSTAPVIPGRWCPNVADGCSAIDKSKPPQFISFERADERALQRRGASRRRVWLRLHNNTSCAIVVPTGSTQLSRPLGGGLTFDLQQDAEVFVDYEIQDRRRSKAPQPSGYGGDEIIISRLPPGRSVLFSIDSTHLKKGLDIVVSFRFEWEGDVSLRSGAVLHRVRFQDARR